MVVRTYIHSFHHNIGMGSDNSMILHTGHTLHYWGKAVINMGPE